MGRQVKMLGVIPALMLAVCGCARNNADLSPSSRETENHATLSADIAALAEPFCANTVSIGVYRGGEIIDQVNWRRDGVDIPSDAQFELGSLTKHLTAIAILKLQEEGELSIDDAIGAHVEGLPESWRAIMLRQLLAHTSGVPDYEVKLGYGFYETDGGRQDILAAMGGDPLDFEPGTNFSYSNTGYYLLSLAIEAASGASYADFMQQNIFAPAGMKQTTIGANGLATLVQGYKSADGAITRVPGIAAESTLGAGALISTVADWNRWQNALASEKIVNAASRELTFQPTMLANGEEVPYGFGMIVDSFRGAARRMHTGQTSGFVARFESYPAFDTSFLILANCHGDQLGAIGKKLALAFIPGLDYSALALPNDPDPPMTTRARSALEQAVLQSGALDLLADGMRAFATSDDYAPLRTALAPSVRTLSSFEYLKTEEAGEPGSGRFVYKAVSNEGVLYWILSFRDGLLTGMNWEDA